MIRITDILDQASTYLSPLDVALIQKAYVFSAAAHAGQIRLSGEPYLSHPLEVSNILVDLRLDAATIVAGLLHDTVEDTETSIPQIVELFGPEVGAIVEGVTKISKMNFESKEQAQAENIRKMILAMADDIRVILVKLADRLHNISTLEFQKEYKQRAIAQETLGIYAPLANRLGLYRIKVQLENYGLQYMKPDVYAQISEGINRYQDQGQAALLHLVVNGIDVFDAALDPALDVIVLQHLLDHGADLVDVGLALIMIAGETFGNLGVYVRLEVLEALVFELDLDAVEAQTVGQGGVNAQGFLGGHSRTTHHGGTFWNT